MSSPAHRISKAWRVRCIWSDDSDVVFAETAGKARYQLMLDIGDFYPSLQFQQIAVERAKEHDRRLPVAHRLVDELTADEQAIVLHAFGSKNRHEPGYRDHYCTHPGDTRLLRLSWELGLFRGPYGEQHYGGTPGWVGAFFYLTDLGKHVAWSMLPTYPRA